MKKFNSGVKIFSCRFGEKIETIDIRKLEDIQKSLEGYHTPLTYDSLYHNALTELPAMKMKRHNRKINRIVDAVQNQKNQTGFDFQAVTVAIMKTALFVDKTPVSSLGENLNFLNAAADKKIDNIKTPVYSCRLTNHDDKIQNYTNGVVARNELSGWFNPTFVSNQYDSVIDKTEKTPSNSYHRSIHNNKRLAVFNTAETKNRIIDSLNRCNRNGQKKLTEEYLLALTDYLKKSEIPENYVNHNFNKQYHAVSHSMYDDRFLSYRNTILKAEKKAAFKVDANGVRVSNGKGKDYRLIYSDTYNEFDKIDLSEITDVKFTRQQTVYIAPTTRILKSFDNGVSGEKVNLKNRKFVCKTQLRSSNEPIIAKLSVDTFYKSVNGLIQQFDTFNLLGYQVIRTYQKQIGLDYSTIDTFKNENVTVEPTAFGCSCVWVSPEQKRILREANKMKTAVKGFNTPKKTARVSTKPVKTTVKTKKGVKSVIELPDKTVSKQKRNPSTGILYDNKTPKPSNEQIDAEKWLAIKIARMSILASREKIEVLPLR